MSLELAHVSLDAPGAPRFQDLSVSVEPREIFVVLGANGCGKSTFLRLCIGLLAPTSGAVRVLGEPLDALRGPALEKLRRQVGYVFQEGALLESLTVRENAALPLAYAGGLTAAARRERVEQCLALVGMTEDAGKRASGLSLGKRKRAAMARAIVARPRLLLLDDPTSGLDSLQAYETVALIRSLRRETGATVVVVSNDATRFLKSADRVAILYKGTFSSVGKAYDVMNGQDPWLSEVFDTILKAESREGEY
ncbi:MAG: ATP-binding cassette domain-containing protein [Planctomycetes bacterium]|nr:ATP-binding cassette domain-containing protein [Planctomycetota bacterium]